MKEYDLADSIVDAMADMSAKVIDHYDQDDLDTSHAIISEWTMDDNVCVLTKFITDDTESIAGELLYWSSDEHEVSYGTFTFDAPLIDNN